MADHLRGVLVTIIQGSRTFFEPPHRLATEDPNIKRTENILCRRIAQALWYVGTSPLGIADATHLGPIVRISPNEVAVNDLSSVKEIHKIGSGFIKSPWYPIISGEDPATAGLFSQRDPKTHSTRRKLFSQPFSKGGIQEWEEMLKEKAAMAVDGMGKAAARNDGVADVLEWWTYMTTDVIAELGFGEGFHALETGQVRIFATCKSSRSHLSPAVAIHERSPKDVHPFGHPGRLSPPLHYRLPHPRPGPPKLCRRLPPARDLRRTRGRQVPRHGEKGRMPEDAIYQHGGGST